MIKKDALISKGVAGIYSITNEINNKFYIGSTVDLNRRKNDHVCALRKNKHICKQLQYSFNKHGEENFRIDVVEVILNRKNITQREQFWIDFLKPEYNIMKKAGASHYGNTANKGRKTPQHVIEKLRAAHTGKKQSEESKRKKSLALIGRKASPSEVAFIKKRMLESPVTKRMVLNTQTGVFYDTMRRAAESTGIKMNIKTFNRKIENGSVTFIYVDEFKSNPKKQHIQPNSVEVLNTQNGIFYSSISDASRSYGAKNPHLLCKLNGRRYNNTPFVYADGYKNKAYAENLSKREFGDKRAVDVINLETGIFYSTVKEAWQSYGRQGFHNMVAKLQGNRTNDTSYVKLRN